MSDIQIYEKMVIKLRRIRELLFLAKFYSCVGIDFLFFADLNFIIIGT
jgi:hypothetical protein